jgi:hypothetical protein
VGKWQILALEDDGGRCDFEEALQALYDDPSTSSTASGFVAVINQIPVNGPRQLGAAFYHRIDKENEIYQFSKRDHRLVCFEDDGALIICSHIFRKTSQRTPDSEVQRAIRLRREYFASKAPRRK